MREHVVPVRVYATILAALLALTGVTTAVAFVDLGVANVVVMLVIAVVKATLVVLFFMHLRWASGLIRLMLSLGVAMLLVLLVITTGDEILRLVVRPPLAQVVQPPPGAFDVGPRAPAAGAPAGAR